MKSRKKNHFHRKPKSAPRPPTASPFISSPAPLARAGRPNSPQLPQTTIPAPPLSPSMPPAQHPIASAALNNFIASSDPFDLATTVQQIIAAAPAANLSPALSLERKLRALVVAEQILSAWFEWTHALPHSKIDFHKVERAVRVLARLTAIQESLSRIQTTLKNPSRGQKIEPVRNPQSAPELNQELDPELDKEITATLAEAIQLQTEATASQNSTRNCETATDSLGNHSKAPTGRRLVATGGAQRNPWSTSSHPCPARGRGFPHSPPLPSTNDSSNPNYDTAALGCDAKTANPCSSDPHDNGRSLSNEFATPAATTAPSADSQQHPNSRPKHNYPPNRRTPFSLKHLNAALDRTNNDLETLTGIKNPLTPILPPEPKPNPPRPKSSRRHSKPRSRSNTPPLTAIMQKLASLSSPPDFTTNPKPPNTSPTPKPPNTS